VASQLVLINGVPRIRKTSVIGPIYDETVTISTGGLTAGTLISLPNAGQYTNTNLEVFIDGQSAEPSVDYHYVGVAPRTQITFTKNLSEGTVIRFKIENYDVTIYNETMWIGVGGIPTGTNIALPNNRSYVGDDLKIYLNDELMVLGIDWNQTDSDPCSDIQMTFDLLEGDRLRFRIDH